jgi:malate permease and related proteins
MHFCLSSLDCFGYNYILRQDAHCSLDKRKGKMKIFALIFQSVLTLISIGVLGFWILKRGIIPDTVITFLSRLAIDIALPCVVFAGILLNFEPQKMPDWWKLPLWWMLFQSIVLVLVMMFRLLSQKNTRNEFGMSLFFQNGLFFPLIVVGGLFGANSQYSILLFIFCIFHPVLLFTTAHLFFKKKGQDHKGGINWARVINPVLVATVLAITLRLAGLDSYLPPFLVTVFTMLGGMTLPLLMIILGGSLYIDYQKKGSIYFAEILKFVAIKNFIFPLIFIGLLILVRPEYSIALIILLQSVVPPATGTSVRTGREGGNIAIANQFILASFAVSVVSIPLMFILFSKYFPAP